MDLNEKEQDVGKGTKRKVPKNCLARQFLIVLRKKKLN